MPKKTGTESVNISDILGAPIVVVKDVPLTIAGSYVAKKGLEKFAEEWVLNHQGGAALASLALGFVLNKGLRIGIGALAGAIKTRREEKAAAA